MQNFSKSGNAKKICAIPVDMLDSSSDSVPVPPTDQLVFVLQEGVLFDSTSPRVTLATLENFQTN